MRQFYSCKSQVAYNVSTGVFDSSPGMMQCVTRQFSKSSGSVSSFSSISLEETRGRQLFLQLLMCIFGQQSTGEFNLMHKSKDSSPLSSPKEKTPCNSCHS